MKKIYIASLSLMASGLLFFGFADSSLAAGVCGVEPYPHCDDLCAKIPDKTPQYDACYDPCYSEYLAADDKYRACQQAEYDKYMAVYEEKSNYEDQKAAAIKQEDDDIKACQDALEALAHKEYRCEMSCIYKVGDSCRKACQDPNFSYQQKSDCVNINCKKSQDSCKVPCQADYDKEVPIQYTQCEADAADRFNKKMNLINQHNWPELQKILDEDDKRAEQKKLADEKAKLESAKAENPDLTTISTGGKGVAVLQADGSWKTVYAQTDIKEGDTIYTGNNSATINYSDGSKIDLGPGSSIKYGDSKILMGLKIATENIVEKKINLLRAKIKLWGKKLEVRTPNAVLADRGTEFIVDYNPDAKITTAYLYDGILDVTNLKNETKELNKGETMTVDNSGKMVLGKLGDGQWDQLSKEITTPKSNQQGAAANSSGKTMIWLVSAVVLICIIGAGVFIYRKK